MCVSSEKGRELGRGERNLCLSSSCGMSTIT